MQTPNDTAAARARHRWRAGLGAVVIVLLAVAVYWPALRGPFLWDDRLVLDQNPLVTGRADLATVWFRTDFPLTMTAFWLEWREWGQNPLGFHVVNLLLHAANALLVWRLLARWRMPGAWFAAALFAAHPVCVASVAWISELKNTLSLFYFLASFLAWQKFEESAAGMRAGRWYALSLGAFLLALLSKTSTVTLPVLLLLAAWWRRGNFTRRDFLRVTPFFLLALALGVLTIRFQAQGAIKDAVVQTEGFTGRLAGAGWALWFYLGKALLPVHLNMIYPRWTINALAPASYLPGALWCGALAVCWRFRNGWGRHAWFALASFTVALFPVLGFFDMFYLTLSRVSDHFQYLPLIAVLALAAAALRRACPAKVFALVAAVLLPTLAWLAAQRAAVFASEETLWRDTLAKNPDAWCAHANLGWILAARREDYEAIDHLETALRLRPENAAAESNLGRLLCLQNRFADAEPHFQAAIRLKPNDPDIRRTYAAALAERGRSADAVVQLRAALSAHPDLATRLQLASTLYQAGRFGEAAAEYRQILASNPDQPEPLNNLAWILATCPDATVRNGAEAVRLAERACRLNAAREARPVGTLAAAYAEAGQFSNAVATAQQAVDLAQAAGDAQFAAVNRQMQALYRGGRAFHESPRKP